MQHTHTNSIQCMYVQNSHTDTLRHRLRHQCPPTHTEYKNYVGFLLQDCTLKCYQTFHLHPRGAEHDIRDRWRDAYRLERRQREERRMCFLSIPTLFSTEREEDLDN